MNKTELPDHELDLIQEMNVDVSKIPNGDCSDKEKKHQRDVGMIYSVNDVPPWYLSILLGMQHYMTAFGSTLSVPLVIAGPLCVGEDFVGKSELIATVFFVSGIATLLQTTLGVRLPIIQGATFAFLTPTIALLNLPKWKCPAHNATIGEELGANQTANDEKLWHSRIREVQGAIVVSCLFQVLIGATGLLTVFLQFVGPLTIAPTITLIGLCLFPVAADKAATHWGIAFLTVFLIALFSQYLSRLNIPLPSYKRGTGCHTIGVPVFKLFPILLAMLTAWLVCFILTICGAFPDDPSTQGYLARTDTRLHVISSSSWLRIPYPGQWGIPTVSVGGVFGMLAGVLASMIESIGDYFACARLSGAPPPPSRAVNRGVLVEGIACIIAGLIGSGNGTTSYSENVAAIGITRVGSRRVVQTAGLLLVLLGCVGKVGALFITIPDPVVGGMFLSLFGMIAAVGLSYLQFVDLNSSRNSFVLACSLFLGLAIPDWLKRNPNAIQIDNAAVEQTIRVLLTTSMFVGGSVGFLLDSTIPGTPEERGILKWRTKPEMSDERSGSEQDELNKVYDLPYISTYLRRKRLTKYVPFCISPSTD